MKTILVFGTSLRKESINHQFAAYVGSLIEGHTINEIPMYSRDVQDEEGFPEGAEKFCNALKTADAFIISSAEHNGNVTAYFKSSVDWVTRIQKAVLQEKPVLLLSTSPGSRGGLGSREKADELVTRYLGGTIVGSFGLPKFSENFSETEGITDSELKAACLEEVKKFTAAL